MPSDTHNLTPVELDLVGGIASAARLSLARAGSLSRQDALQLAFSPLAGVGAEAYQARCAARAEAEPKPVEISLAVALAHSDPGWYERLTPAERAVLPYVLPEFADLRDARLAPLFSAAAAEAP